MRYILVILFSLISFAALADPTIDNSTPTTGWTHDASITIYSGGNDFGSKSPAAPVVWDACDDESTNDLDTHYPQDSECTNNFFRGPPVDQTTIPNPGEEDCEVEYKALPWKGFSSPDEHITKVIGTCHTSSDGTMSGHGSNYADMFVTIPDWDENTLFLMYWYRANENYSTESSPDAGENWKELTPNGSEGGHGGCYLDGSDGVTWGWCGGGCPNETAGDVYAMGGAGSCASGSRVYNHNPRFQWTHFEHIWDTSGHYFYSTIGEGSVKGGFAQIPINYAGSTNPNNEPKSISIGGFNRWPRDSDVDNHRMWTGIYADNTFSRVMLGNASTWANCTKREPQIPSAWASDEITVTVNLGSFVAGTDDAYLYVFDSNNDANATGYEVTLEGSTAIQRAILFRGTIQ